MRLLVAAGDSLGSLAALSRAPKAQGQTPISCTQHPSGQAPANPPAVTSKKLTSMGMDSLEQSCFKEDKTHVCNCAHRSRSLAALNFLPFTLW